MKQITFFLLLLFTTLFESKAQTIFQKNYGSPVNDGFGSMTASADGGYVVAGASFGFASSFSDIFLYKTDSIGNLLWDKVFLGRRSDVADRVRSTSDGGFIILFETNSFDTTSTKIVNCLIKTDNAGNLVWAKTYDVFSTVNNNYPKDVIETNDQGFLIVGGNSAEENFAIKISQSGGLQWAYSFGRGLNYSAFQLNNGDFLMLGTSRFYPGPNYRTHLIKINSLGNILWSKVYASTQNEIGIKIISADSSGIVIAGQTVNSGQGGADLMLLQLDTSGVVQWGKTYGGINDETLADAIRTNDNGFLMYGTSTSFIFGSSFQDLYAVKTDSSGGLEWANHYGTPSSEFAYSASEAQGGGYVLAGTVSSFGLGQGDSYLLKTNLLGFTGCHEAPSNTVEANYQVNDSTILITPIQGGMEYDIKVRDTSGVVSQTECIQLLNTLAESDNMFSPFTISPNPGRGQFRLESASGAISQILVLDLAGRRIIERQNINQRSCFLNGIPAGIYVIQVTDEFRHVKQLKFVSTE